MKKRTVLIVDDSAVSRTIVRSCLPRGAELEVLEAGGGHDGLKLHQQHDPDVTFLDLTMGDMSGMECLKEIKARSPGSVVVVVTADVQARSIQSAMDLGALDVVRKPPTRQVIEAAYARAIALVEQQGRG